MFVITAYDVWQFDYIISVTVGHLKSASNLSKPIIIKNNYLRITNRRKPTYFYIESVTIGHQKTFAKL